MSSITWNLSSAATAQSFTYTSETTFRTKKTASPVHLQVGITSEMRPRINDVEIDTRNLGSHILYAQQTAFHSFGLGLNTFPFDLPLMKYGSLPPDYTTPAGTQQESIQFLYKYKQATGTAGMSDYYIFFLGSKMNTLELSVSSQGLVQCAQDWIVGEVTAPSLTHGLTTPTIPALSAVSTPPISNIDGGNNPFTFNGVSYPIKEFRVQWNNNLIADDFNGSGYVDQISTGGIKITGSFRVPTGKDLAMETAILAFPQTGVNATYVFKTGVMVLQMTGVKLVADDNPHIAGPQDTDKHTYNFEAITASLGTS